MTTEAEVRAILEAAGFDPEADSVMVRSFVGERRTRNHGMILGRPLWQHVMEKISKGEGSG